MKVEQNVLHNNQKLIYMLAQRKRNLERAISSLDRFLGDAPEGSLVVIMNKGKYPQYYHVRDKRKTYLSKKKMGLIKALAQKQYDLKLRQNLSGQLKLVSELLRVLENEDPLSVYYGLSSQRRALVKSRVLTDEEFIARWYNDNPGSRNGMYMSAPLLTDRGEYVRSKSEKILADRLFKENVPYVYEPELWLDELTVLYPDFKLLDIANRSESYHEHFGMIDNPGYAENCAVKLDEYAEVGYSIGPNLTITMESRRVPLSRFAVDGIVERNKNRGH